MATIHGLDSARVAREIKVNDAGELVVDTTSSTGGGGSGATATLSNINDSATSVTLLAANTDRKGVIVFNDSTQPLHLKLGATASLTSFTVMIQADGYWEMPSPIYTGIIDGIWTSDASGAARITELT